MNFFGYYDERDRGGWQSALRRADGSERPANAAVATAIAAGCTTGLRSWAPLAKPERAAVEFGALNAKSRGQKLVVRYTPTAGEDVMVKAGFVPASTPAARIPALLADAGRVDANRRPPRTAHATVSATPQVLAVVRRVRAEPVPRGRLHEPRVQERCSCGCEAEARQEGGEGEAREEGEEEAGQAQEAPLTAAD